MRSAAASRRRTCRPCTIARDAQRENYRFSAVVLSIVRSVPFQMRIKVKNLSAWRSVSDR